MAALPLFDAYPRLAGALPRVALAQYPTPVQRMEQLESALNCGARIFVKRDDLSSNLYGGNKPRKLEFLLGKALQDKRRTVLTFGAAGSNHTLATAIFARQLGLHPIVMLVPQPNARYVRKNLLASRTVDAELHYSGSMPGVAANTLRVLAGRVLREGRLPMVIAPGGTSALGVVGYVNAAFELRRQIEAGDLPEPDRVYVAAGTMGTATGLLLGFQAAGLKSQIVAVRVTDPSLTSMSTARRFFRKTGVLLHAAEPAFPLGAFPDNAFQFREEFYGGEYARYTEEGMRAVRLVHDAEGLALEGTYTGKAFAALLADADAARGKTLLFWDTYNSRDFTNDVKDVDYHTLPKPLHRYFEEDVQPLDRVGD